MKLKQKIRTLALAATLVYAGSASAAFDNAASGNSALIFSAWDSTTGASYTRGLGFNLNEFLAPGPGFQSFTADSLFTTTFGSSISSGTFRWNVVGADSNLITTTVGDPGAANRHRTVSTSTVNFAGLPVLTRGQNNQAALNMDAYLQKVNNFCGGSTGTNTGSCNSLNPSEAWNINNGSMAWGNGLGVAAGFNTAGAIGQSLFMMFASGTGTTTSVVQEQTSFGGIPRVWTLAGDGTLTWNETAVGEIPVPAAVWLLASGLLGFAGVSRRKKVAA
jgi:hypothetical protein